MGTKTEQFKQIAWGKRNEMEKLLWRTLFWNSTDTVLAILPTNKREWYQNIPGIEDTNRARLKTNEALHGWFIQQSNQNNLEKRKHVLSDLNRTLAQSGPDDELTEEEFNKALRRSRKDTTPGPDRIWYSDIKNRTEEDKAGLYTIYQESFDKGYIPQEWTDSFLRPISWTDTTSSQCKTPLGSSWNTLLPGNSPETSRSGWYSLQIQGGGVGGGIQTRKMHMGKCSCICIWRV